VQLIGLIKLSGNMWTPLFLLCTVSFSDCTTYGGPIFETEAMCYKQIQTIGLPYLKNKFPSANILQIKCINWDSEKSKVDT
tara:strand:+ start:18 stop:260 length:243 start_codon:yes stop_codon:yes gene_type:complete